MYLSDDHPLWDDHSGGSGHDGPEWTDGDEDRVLTYWDVLDDKARAVLRYLFSRRGHQIHHSELVRELGLDPEGTKNSANVMAGTLTRAGDANKETGHRYPFHWWEGENGASYGVKDCTAAIFERALFADQTKQKQGELLTFGMSSDQVEKFIDRLVVTMDDTDVRMVLGSACTTAMKAVQQFAAALQLPYEAAQGWREFLDHLDDRAASLRQCVVVTDACQMLKHEDADIWREAVAALQGGPHHLGGGWSTLVLLDDESAWNEWVFKTAADIRPPSQH